MTVPSPFITAAPLLMALVVAVGCGQQSSDPAEVAGERVEEAVEKTGEMLGHNVEDASKTARDTYEEKREEGEGRVQAAGDAYQAVQERAH